MANKKPMKTPEELEKTLEIMEVVETELEAQKKEVIFCLTIFLCAVSFWTLLCALWEYLGKPISGQNMTIGVELIALLMLVLIWKFTKLDIRKMGVSKKNLKSSLMRDGIISFVILGLMTVVKLVMKPGQPLVDWSLFNPFYVLTCLFQEFLARGFLLTTLLNINSTLKYKNHIAIFCSSLIFTSLHLYYGFFFMVGAGVLSLILGYLYLKDENIWGVSLIHYTFGMYGIMLGLV